MSLCENLKEKNKEIWNKILNHEFIQEIAKTTLKIDKWKYYLCQDSLYLDSLLRVLAYAAAKAPTRDLIQFFAKTIIDTIQGEIEMQRKIKSKIGVLKLEMSSLNEEYTKFLLGIGKEGSFWEIVASILPCFWTYQLIGKGLKKTKASTHKLFRLWVKGYTSKPYNELVKKLKKIMNEALNKVDQNELKRIMEYFKKSSEFELKFWDMAYSYKGS
ncbi:MAG: thiaminase II [Candidatus Bathyarchaeia archaeon]